MTKFALWIALILVGAAAATLAVMHFTTAQVWVQRAVIPGDLSQVHAFLENNCMACHTPGKGVVAASCITCHANNTALLQRQPTAFHAEVQSCAACHIEHQGRSTHPIQMDHAALQRIGLRQIRDASWHANDTPEVQTLMADENEVASGDTLSTDYDTSAVRMPNDAESPMAAQNTAQIREWLDSTHPKQSQPATKVQPMSETMIIAAHNDPTNSRLNCAVCHQTKDVHRGLFGTSCIQCHNTDKWTIAEFRHPLPTSTSCVQCHQAPPSHYMMHFKMISMPIARQERAAVNQCYLCHQTTSWNDIKGAGFYKHH